MLDRAAGEAFHAVQPRADHEHRLWITRAGGWLISDSATAALDAHATDREEAGAEAKALEIARGSR